MLNRRKHISFRTETGKNYNKNSPKEEQTSGEFIFWLFFVLYFLESVAPRSC